MGKFSDETSDQLFRAARSHNAWSDQPVTDKIIRDIYELARWGPTAANTNPGRFVFVRTAEAKARLLPHVSDGNADKVRSAPCAVIVAWDNHFYERLGRLFPSRDMRGTFDGKDALIIDTAQRNGTLQGAYLMMAARALDLDCGPMSGFDRAGVDREFFPDGRWSSNFLCNLGYGDHTKLFPRNPRLEFDDACLVL